MPRTNCAHIPQRSGQPVCHSRAPAAETVMSMVASKLPVFSPVWVWVSSRFARVADPAPNDAPALRYAGGQDAAFARSEFAANSEQCATSGNMRAR